MSSLNPAIAGVNFVDVDASAKFKVGTKALDSNGTLYQYVQAGGTAPVQYTVYAISSAFVLTAAGVTHASMGSGATPTKIGIPQQSGWVASQYGWVAIQGPVSVLVSEAVDAGDKLYTTATAGQLGDTSASQTLIGGLAALAATGGAGTVTANAIIELASNAFA